MPRDPQLRAGLHPVGAAIPTGAAAVADDGRWLAALDLARRFGELLVGAGPSEVAVAEALSALGQGLGAVAVGLRLDGVIRASWGAVAAGSSAGPVEIRASSGARDATLVVTHPLPSSLAESPIRPLLPLLTSQLAQALEDAGTRRELEADRDRFRMFSEASSEGMCIHRDGLIVDVNDAMLAMVGAERARVVGTKVLDWVHPEERAEVEARIRDGRPPMPAGRIVRTDGTLLWCETSARQAIRADGTYRVLAIRDVGAARETQLRLRESEERFRILGESTYDGIAVLDGTTILWANPSFARMFGYESGQVLGLTPDDLHAPDDVADLLDRTEGGGHDAIELVGIRKDGTTFPVMVRGRWCRMSGRLVRITGYLDLTAGREAEQRQRALEAQVLHTQKLESLGLMAGGIAHDFNNLLVGVLGNAELAALEPSLSPRIASALDRIRTAAQRASELTHQMLAYAGKGRFEVSSFEVDRRISDMVALLRVSMGKRVRLDLALGAVGSQVEGDPAQLDQIVLNLITNANDAIGERDGVVRVATRREELFEAGPVDVMDQPLPRGPYVVIEVSDTGEGMAPEVLPRIFEPFFTTKFTGRGLGLAAVHGIVRAHEGAVEVESQVGQGTRFRVWLPASPLRPAIEPGDDQRAPAAARPAPRGRRGHVLITDDEPSVREVARLLLTRAGFTTETASDGHEAIARVSERPEAFDAVLLDLTMPGPDGRETLARLRQIRPGLPVVLCSGYAAPIRWQGTGNAGSEAARPDDARVSFLQKPFRVADLIHSLEAAVGLDPRIDPTG